MGGFGKDKVDVDAKTSIPKSKDSAEKIEVVDMREADYVEYNSDTAYEEIAVAYQNLVRELRGIGEADKPVQDNKTRDILNKYKALHEKIEGYDVDGLKKENKHKRRVQLIERALEDVDYEFQKINNFDFWITFLNEQDQGEVKSLTPLWLAKFTNQHDVDFWTNILKSGKGNAIANLKPVWTFIFKNQQAPDFWIDFLTHREKVSVDYLEPVWSHFFESQDTSDAWIPILSAGNTDTVKKLKPIWQGIFQRHDDPGFWNPILGGSNQAVIDFLKLIWEPKFQGHTDSAFWLPFLEPGNQKVTDLLKTVWEPVFQGHADIEFWLPVLESGLDSSVEFLKYIWEPVFQAHEDTVFWTPVWKADKKDLTGALKYIWEPKFQAHKDADYWIQLLGQGNPVANDTLKFIWEPIFSGFRGGNARLWPGVLGKGNETASGLLEYMWRPAMEEAVQGDSKDLKAVSSSGKSDVEKKADAGNIYTRNDAVYIFWYDKLISSAPAEVKPILDSIKTNAELAERTKYLGIRILLKVNNDFPQFGIFMKDFKVEDFGAAKKRILGTTGDWAEDPADRRKYRLNPVIKFNTEFFGRLKMIEKMAKDTEARPDDLATGTSYNGNTKYKSRISADFDATVAHEAGHLLAHLISRKQDINHNKGKKKAKTVKVDQPYMPPKSKIDRGGETKILKYIAGLHPRHSAVKPIDLKRGFKFSENDGDSNFDSIMKAHVSNKVNFKNLTVLSAKPARPGTAAPTAAAPCAEVKKFCDTYNANIATTPLEADAKGVIAKEKATYIPKGTNLSEKPKLLKTFVARCPYSWGIPKEELSGYASTDICETVAEAFGDYYTAYNENGKTEEEREGAILPFSRDVFHAYQKLYKKWDARVKFES